MILTNGIRPHVYYQIVIIYLNEFKNSSRFQHRSYRSSNSLFATFHFSKSIMLAQTTNALPRLICIHIILKSPIFSRIYYRHTAQVALNLPVRVCIYEVPFHQNLQGMLSRLFRVYFESAYTTSDRVSIY